ncbi:MAG: ribonuclease III [Alphaproteobacteria bacterium]|nr:ribonuclease III [Alphaproteobacteria bacterium]
MPAKKPHGLAKSIGHVFSNQNQLEQALTHPSARTAKFRKGGKRVHENERLEFLGDRVLGLVIAEWLMELFPDGNEGELAQKLNALVRKETCADIARQVELDRYILVGNTERGGGVHKRTAVLGDAMESVIAAIYLDGGYAAAQDVIRRLWQGHMEAVGTVLRDPKTVLQEWAQGRGLAAPTYKVVSQSGPDHNPKFEIDVEVEGLEGETGCGGTKRGAEQNAAEKLLQSQSIKR